MVAFDGRPPFFDGRSRSQGHTVLVVDDLGVEVQVGLEHRKAGANRSSTDLLANPGFDVLALVVFFSGVDS